MKTLRSRMHSTPLRLHWQRSLGVLAICALLALALSFDALYAPLQQLLKAAEPLITANPFSGGLLFVVLAALSAMLAYFSSALLVPIAVYSWGEHTTIALLWLSWLLGGLGCYTLGWLFGQPLLRRLIPARFNRLYLERLPAQLTLPIALLIQLALPSEIPGYLFGALRVRLRIYMAALALVEAPYAIGTVLLGESIIQRQSGWLLALAVLGLSSSLLAVYLLHRNLHPKP